MLKCSSLARQYQAACTAHLGLPLAPVFSTSEERGKCFCAGSRYSWCAAWWLQGGGPRQARSPRRLLRHHLWNNPKINLGQAHTEPRKDRSRWDRQRSEPGAGQWLWNGQCRQRSFGSRRAESQRRESDNQQQRINRDHREITRGHGGHNKTAAPPPAPIASAWARNSDDTEAGKRKTRATRMRKTSR